MNIFGSSNYLGYIIRHKVTGGYEIIHEDSHIAYAETIESAISMVDFLVDYVIYQPPLRQVDITADQLADAICDHFKAMG